MPVALRVIPCRAGAAGRGGTEPAGRSTMPAENVSWWASVNRSAPAPPME